MEACLILTQATRLARRRNQRRPTRARTRPIPTRPPRCTGWWAWMSSIQVLLTTKNSTASAAFGT